VEPPAAHGTIRLIGLVGFHCWAWAVPASASAAAVANRVFKKVRVCMVGLPSLMECVA
jgi:hypothetical protein